MLVYGDHADEADPREVIADISARVRRGDRENARIEAEEFRELDGGRILVFVHNSGRARTSELQIEQMRVKAADVFHVHDGKVTRLVAYWNRDRALTDLGLEE